ncbi:MAG: hypothetical protein M3Z37_08225 [Candidatus Eremiobacteraeota bacterium]|nr:hypothetical protein [Candidatus Eremiobacteraeota bacterium]
MTTQKAVIAGALSAMLSLAPLTAVNADSLLNKVLIGAGGILAVKAVAAPLNSFIDNLMLTNHVANRGKTKVVPIVTIGSATYLGAAQVSGPAYAVDRTQAVGEFAADWNNNVWQVRALVPVDNLNVLRGFKRVYGVGVNAVINARL